MTGAPEAGEVDEIPEADEVREVREVREVGEVREENIRSVRLGHGANCSSVGSVVDTLFLGAALGGVVFAAVCAAMKVEAVTVVGNRPRAGAGDAATPEGEPEDEGEAAP